MSTQDKVAEMVFDSLSIKYDVLVVNEPSHTDGPDLFLSVILDKNNISVDSMKKDMKRPANTHLRFEPVSLCESKGFNLNLLLPSPSTHAKRHRLRAKSALYGSVHPDRVASAMKELKSGADLGDDECLNLLHVVRALHGSGFPETETIHPMTKNAFEKTECADWAGEGKLYESLRDLLLNKGRGWIPNLVAAASLGNLLAWALLRAAGKVDDQMARLVRLHVAYCKRFPRDATV